MAVLRDDHFQRGDRTPEQARAAREANRRQADLVRKAVDGDNQALQELRESYGV